MHTSIKTHNAQKNTLLVDTSQCYPLLPSHLWKLHTFQRSRSNGRQRNRFHGRANNLQIDITLARLGDNHTLMMLTILLVAHLSNTPNSLGLSFMRTHIPMGLYCKPTSHHPINSNDNRVVYLLKVLPNCGSTLLRHTPLNSSSAGSGDTGLG